MEYIWDGLCITGVFCCLGLAYAIWREVRKKRLGKVIYNLTINVKCCKRTFGNTPLYTAENEIEIYGVAICKAKKIFSGGWGVTEKGYLVRKLDASKENRSASLEIDIAIPGVELLFKRLADGTEVEDHPISRVCLDFESWGFRYVGVDKTGMYLY